ncbi:MAG: purine-nucleoside phosphorylase [Clostridia bacterium]|nr:purine-nucleoside phosphorylase [Clostridia bacterium]
MSIPTPHITCKKEDFAKTVLMPGDPLRSKFIAETYLEDAKLVNDVRGVQGYTGYYKGKRVSVMASGMGQPSIGIYSYELFNFYDVSSIIRVGSCGSYQADLKPRDIVLAMGACTNSSFADQYGMNGRFAPIASFELLRRAVDECEKAGVNYRVGNVFSSDVFYNDTYNDLNWAKLGVLGVEMEAAALYATAARAGKKALCICSVSDSLVDTSLNLPADERRTAFTKMMEIALEVAEA